MCKYLPSIQTHSNIVQSLTNCPRLHLIRDHMFVTNEVRRLSSYHNYVEIGERLYHF